MEVFHQHSQDQIIGNPSSEVRTRSSLRNICNNLAWSIPSFIKA